MANTREACEMHEGQNSLACQPQLCGNEPGEPCAGKLASTVCAVRRVVVSLLEAGGMREDIPGLSVYLDAKAEGDKSRLRKRGMLESVVEQGHRMTRSPWVKLDCLNSNPDGVNVRAHRKNA